MKILHYKNYQINTSITSKFFGRAPTSRAIRSCAAEIRRHATPIQQYTNDKSAMDAFIRFNDNDGGEHLIAIETKYTDSLGTNKAKDDTLKIQFAIESGLFTPEGITHIKTNCTQIYRNFLLTEKFRVVNGLKDSYSIILAPENHPSTDKEIASLNVFLKEEYKNLKLNKLSLESFVEKLKENCPVEYMDWLDWFEDRYLNFEKLDEMKMKNMVL